MRSRVTAVWAIAAVSGLGACGPTSPPAEPVPPAPAEVLEAAARADSVRAFYNEADVSFMTGMIHHHAQALVMAGMAPTHAGTDELKRLAARIETGQWDEIRLMQRWLRERGEPVPTVREDGTTGMMGHHGGHHGDMVGMLSPEQMAELRDARGERWDELFLRYMIQHHQGAVVMVDELFSTYGAGQGDEIFRIASDINVDQRTEIDRMQRMLEARVFGGGS